MNASTICVHKHTPNTLGHSHTRTDSLAETFKEKIQQILYAEEPRRSVTNERNVENVPSLNRLNHQQLKKKKKEKRQNKQHENVSFRFFFLHCSAKRKKNTLERDEKHSFQLQ